jgi:hypothetical protein
VNLESCFIRNGHKIIAQIPLLARLNQRRHRIARNTTVRGKVTEMCPCQEPVNSDCFHCCFSAAFFATYLTK